MDNDSEPEVDEGMASMMGFSGFGSKPNKKRKIDRGEAFVDPDIGRKPDSKRAHGTGANALPTGNGKTSKPQQREGSADRLVVRSATDATTAQNPSEVSGSSSSILEGKTSDGNHRTNLNALRHGVVNGHGVVAYFLPSFLEDPWKGLKPQ